MLRLTRPRAQVLAVLYRIGGRIQHPEGRVVAQLAQALHHSGSLTSLKRVLSALELHGLIICDSRSGRVHAIELTPDGEQLVHDHELVDTSPRRHLLDERVCRDREVLVLAASTVAERLTDWARHADTSRPWADIQLDSTLAVHEAMSSRPPDEDELAVLVARTRVALGNLLDTYLTDPSLVDAPSVESGLRAILDVHHSLIAWHWACQNQEGRSP